MAPKYLSELKYTHLVATFAASQSGAYRVDSPESAFDRNLQSIFLDAQEHIHHEEYNLALRGLRELSVLILKLAHPTLPIDPNTIHLELPYLPELIDVIGERAISVLTAAIAPSYSLPGSAAAISSIVSKKVATTLAPLTGAGIQVTSFHAGVGSTLEAAAGMVKQADWDGALKLYQSALRDVPADHPTIKAALLQDMALLTEKSGNPAQAVKLAQKSIEALGHGALSAGVDALDVATGIARRSGDEALAKKLAADADQIRTTTNLNPLVVAPRSPMIRDAMVTPLVVGGIGGRIGNPVVAARPRDSVAADLMATAVSTAGSMVDSPVLIAAQVVQRAQAVKSFVAVGSTEQISFALAGAAGPAIRGFMDQYKVTTDLGIVSGYLWNPDIMVAFLPHLYFFTIPMAIGDCLVGLGDLDDAIATYTQILAYPYINQPLEVPRLWNRLAQAVLDRADTAYRNARDDVAQYGVAASFYEQIVHADSTIPNGSPLYADGSFAPLKARIQAFLAAADPAAHDDNPALTSIVLQARTRLQQIAAGLNFFGFAPDYVPPFSFDYLQTTTRYFAQQASQIEQRFIQFKSQAENEQLQRDQLAQQAEVARQSVVLEQRGVTEAQRGVQVATASEHYAQTQLNNTTQAKNDFQNNRWELLELAEAEAWASASAVDHDDQVKLTWNGNYYSSSKKNRNQVLQDLAYQRARLSQDLESKRLDREIASAQAYVGVAHAQGAQADARVAVAQQRVVVAQLQQKYAEVNRDFLDMKEFGAQLWYDLAAQAGRLRTRYLDMATEMAFLTERAYNAETGRGLHVVQYDYQHTTSGNLLGADLLLADVDFFTYDHVSTTKTRKQPVKATISLADAYPVQFNTFKHTGICMFETALEDFERATAGLYLAKVRNVELVFVGIASATGVAGTLRNVGVSRFRDADGTVVERLYPADVMVLSQFDLRQDALAFPFSPNDLRLFENNGIATSWQLDMPLSANDFNFDDLLDVHLVLYYDGFFDESLESQIRAALPASASGSRVFSMAMSFPDELFYLANQGSGDIALNATLFPASQVDLVCTRALLKLTGSGGAGATVHISSPALGGAGVQVTADGSGEVDAGVGGSPLAPLQGAPLLQTITLEIDASANAGIVTDGEIDPSKLGDVQLFVEYDFNYR